MESKPIKPWTKEEWENRSPHPDWKEKFDKRTAATIDCLEFYQEREADICKAVEGVSDGGKFRNDVIEHLQLVMTNLAATRQELTEFHDHIIDIDQHDCEGIPGGCPVLDVLGKLP